MFTRFRIWWIQRKRHWTVRDLVFMVRAAEMGYDVPKSYKVGTTAQTGETPQTRRESDA